MILRDWTRTQFMGVKTVQYFVDLVLWEHLLNEHKDVKRIIELGTFCGGLSLFLLLQSIQRDIEFVTFDDGSSIVRYEPEEPFAIDTNLGKLAGFADCYIDGDIFGEQQKTVESYIQKPGRCILICDNGDKPKEFATFAPLTRPRDIITVHDWDTEIFAKDIDYDLVEEFMLDECREVGSMTRFFYRREE